MNENNHTDGEYRGINKLLKSSSLKILFEKLGDGSFDEFLGDWKWIFTFTKRYKRYVLLYTLLGLFSSTLSLAASYLGRILINIIVDRQTENLWMLVASSLFSLIFSLLVGSVMGRIGLKISIDINNDIQAEIFHKIIDAEWAELHRYQNGDLLNRFNSDVGTVSGNAIGWIPGVVVNLYSFVLTFLLLFRTDPTMAWFAFASAPFLLLVSRFVLRRLREYKKRVTELGSQMTAFEVETFYNFDMIKSFGVTSDSEDKLKAWQGKYRDFSLDYNKFEIKSNILLSLVSTAVSAAAFGYCLYRLWTGQIQYGDMTFFLTQRGNLAAKFKSLVQIIPGMVSSSISAHRIRELVDLPKEAHDPAAAALLASHAEGGITVSMHDVSFSYRDGETVYEHGTVLARPGEIIAVLGPSGEGKTTMLRLLLGLVHPSDGSVTLEDSEGCKIPMNSDLRALFSYVPQGNSMMSGTIADNLRMVKKDATDEEITEALRMACAWEFVSLHPDGINRTVGEKGAGLSEGQAQRIAIARAVLRDAPILLLDEATSALDFETEDRVLKNIIRSRPNRTCIVSTHRKSVLRQCRRVYIIENKTARECAVPPEITDLPE